MCPRGDIHSGPDHGGGFHEVGGRDKAPPFRYVSETNRGDGDSLRRPGFNRQLVCSLAFSNRLLFPGVTDIPKSQIRRGSHTAEAEKRSLALGIDVQKELSAALDSLGGQPIERALDKFIGFSGRHLNYAIEGYLHLRQANRVNASKLLVRPIIEFWFRLEAVLHKPELFYRIMFTERRRRSIWLRALSQQSDQNFDETAEAEEWEVLRQHCLKTIEECDVSDQTISAESLATAAELHSYYDSHYRTYCMFTHGHLEAVLGNFDPITDPEDNLIVGRCGLGGIYVLCSIGGTSSAADSLADRLIALSRPSP
jgi:hypothetical protein